MIRKYREDTEKMRNQIEELKTWCVVYLKCCGSYICAHTHITGSSAHSHITSSWIFLLLHRSLLIYRFFIIFTSIMS